MNQIDELGLMPGSMALILPQRCKRRRASDSRRQGWRRSTLLRTLDNTESEVFRRSRRV